MSSRLMARCHGITKTMARKYLDHRKPFRRSLGHWAAASRELFVRTGVLFCTHGDLQTPASPETRARLVGQRKRLDKHELDFAALLEAENLFCDLKALVPFAKWHIPNAGGTGQMQMFVSRVLPEDHAASCSWKGVGSWRAPVNALVQGQRGEISLDFRTYACLRTLSDFPNAETLFTEYRLEE